MCGIAGIFFDGKISGKELKKFEAAIAKINDSQASRGPDDSGISFFENGVFGHRRLSILDLSKKGHQPFSYPYKSANIRINQRLNITFNGEIYNFLELRGELEKKGYKFKTKTDTEVILALYAEHGEKSFAMLRGMFAFGLWDGKNKKLFLVKDRYGIKPLYYYSDGGKLVFASTVKAISESGLVKAEKNRNALIGFLLFGSVPLPFTTIKNVLAVPAGHYLAVGGDGTGKLIKYYDPLDFFALAGKRSLIAEDDAVNEVQKRLNDSVNIHLISDAPLGVFLSGGLDSSAIAAMAAAKSKKQITTLSIIFDEKEFSEQKYQRMVADRIKSDHREIKITKQDFQDSFENIFDAMDQPTIDGVNSFFIAGAAKKAGLKAVLSGMGADEIFLGYSHFKKASILKKYQNLPDLLKNTLSFLIPSDSGRFSKLSYLNSVDVLRFYLVFRGLFIPEQVAKILGINIKEVNDFIDQLNSSLLSDERIIELSPANLLSYLEIKFYLQNQLLKDADFMSMYHSVEVRVPFLDHPLVEYLSSLPPELKIGKEINKPLLVESVRGLLPEEIFTRPKMGFTFPFQKWLADSQINKLSNSSIINGHHWSRQWAMSVFDKFK